MAIAITNLRGNCIMIARDIDELNWVYPSHGLYEHQKNLLKGKIENKSDHPLKTAAETYLTALENIDISSFSYPFTTTLEKHMSDQGHTVVSSLQIY